MNIVYGSEKELREMMRADAKAAGRQCIEIEAPRSIADVRALLRVIEDAETQQGPGCMCAPCQGAPANTKEVLDQLRRDAKNGDADAALSLAAIYSSGHGVSLNPRKAYKWLVHAAKLGHTAAHHQLGYMYYNGDGVKQDKQEAAIWWEMGAEQGDAVLQTCLAGMLYEGDGILRDYQKSVKWSSKAAAQGNLLSIYNLGVCYSLGHGVPQNYVQAYAWHKIAASRGMGAAAVSLADITKQMSRAQIKEGRKLSRIYGKKIRRQISAAAKSRDQMM